MGRHLVRARRFVESALSPSLLRLRAGRRPQAIGDIFGSTEKTKVLGMLTSVQTSTQIFSPVIGDLADKMPESCSRYFGRRRPFVLFGHLMYCGGFIFSYL